MKWRIVALAVACVIGGAMALKFTTAYTDYAMACEFTGSHQGYRQWLWGAKSDEWYRASPIEKRLGSSNVKHQWVAYRGTQYNAFGGVRAFSRSRPHDAALLSDVFWPYYASLPEAEVRSIYEGLQDQDKAKVKALVSELEARIRRFR